MINPALSLLLERSKTVQKIVDKNPDLAEYIEMLDELIQKRYEDNQGMSEQADRHESIRNELAFYIEKNPNLKKKWNNIVLNGTLYNWFLEYRKDNGKEASYSLIADRAFKEGLLSEVVYNRSIRRRLVQHCERNNIRF
jgi:predicted transcriptional regulator